MDLIINFPKEKIGYIGFHSIRLDFAKGNLQSEAFWIKNHFEKTGVEVQNDGYVAVVMERDL